MEIKLEQRLEASEKRLEEVDKLLMEESTMKDMKLFRDLSKERANLAPVVEKYLEYKKVVQDKEEAMLMANDSDEELSLLGKEELKRLSELEPQIIDDIRLLLLPKDPNDDKNIIV